MTPSIRPYTIGVDDVVVEVVACVGVHPTFLDGVREIVAQLRAYRLDRRHRSLDGVSGQTASDTVDKFAHIYRPPCTIVNSCTCVALQVLATVAKVA